MKTRKKVNLEVSVGIFFPPCVSSKLKRRKKGSRQALSHEASCDPTAGRSSVADSPLGPLPTHRRLIDEALFSNKMFGAMHIKVKKKVHFRLIV